MRVSPFIFAMMIAIGFAPAAAPASSYTAPAGNTTPAEILQRDGVARLTATMLQHGAPEPSLRITPTQAPYGPCSAQGLTMCWQGWLEVCQCFSYGCQFMATAQRC